MSGGSCSRSMAADTGDGARAPTKNVTAATMKQDKHTALQNACGVIFYSTFFLLFGESTSRPWPPSLAEAAGGRGLRWLVVDAVGARLAGAGEIPVPPPQAALGRLGLSGTGPPIRRPQKASSRPPATIHSTNLDAPAASPRSGLDGFIPPFG